MIRNRVKVEIEWLAALAASADIVECPAFSAATKDELKAAHQAMGGKGKGGCDKGQGGCQKGAGEAPKA